MITRQNHTDPAALIAAHTQGAALALVTSIAARRSNVQAIAHAIATTRSGVGR